MYIEKIQLWGGDDMATLTTYCLDDSAEFQAGQKRPAVIVCPGGAYLGTSDREAEPVAMQFAAKGFHAFVLRYNTYYKKFSFDFSTPQETNPNSLWPQPLFDLAKSILTVRENSQAWHVDPDKIFICGFSAGGNLVGNMSTQWHEAFLQEKFEVDNEFLKPNAAIMGYPVADYFLMKEKNAQDTDEGRLGLWKISNMAVFADEAPTDEQLASITPASHVSDKTAPTFIWHTAQDSLVYPENALNHALALTRNNIPYEMHMFEQGAHGLSLCDETTASEPGHIIEDNQVWMDMAIKFLKRR